MKFEIKVSHDSAPVVPTPTMVPVDKTAIASRMKDLLGVNGGKMQNGMTPEERQAELEKLTKSAADGVEAAEPTDLVSQLKDALGDAVVMSFLARGAHWNVQGVNFQQFHDFFGSIYEDLTDSIDPIAENIRKVNASAPFLLTDFIEADYPEGYNTASVDPTELSTVLYKANCDTKESLQGAFDAATAANEQGIANFLAERLDMHSKWQWQLRSIIGDAAANAAEMED